MSDGYRDAMARLLGLAPRGIDLGLERVRSALALVGNPQEALRAVHVAGTNGKGSVTAALDAMARAAGLRVGRYTSPHLHRFGERITVDGVPIDDARLVELAQRLLGTPELPPLTFFEAATVLALEHFAASSCELVILETGLGGRLDATNVVPKVLAVVTNIGLDHQNYLGDTHAAIAAEKAGILAPRAPLLHGIGEPSAREVVEARARALGVPVYALGREARASVVGETLDVTITGVSVRSVPMALAGAHQRDNLALAVAAAVLIGPQGFSIDEQAIRHGAGHVVWPARLETLPGAPRVLLDGAHNLEGAEALVRHLRHLPRGPRALVFGGMADKPLAPMLRALRGEVDSCAYCSVGLPRSASPEALAAMVPGSTHASVVDALAEASARVGPDGLVVVAGSLFVVARARAHLLDLPEDPPIAM